MPGILPRGIHHISYTSSELRTISKNLLPKLSSSIKCKLFKFRLWRPSNRLEVHDFATSFNTNSNPIHCRNQPHSRDSSLCRSTVHKTEHSIKTHHTFQKLSAGLLNPWSVCNKADTIRDFIVDQNLDILALTETWLNGSIKDDPIISSLLPNGYNFIHVPRQSRGGGTALIHRSNLVIRQVSQPQVFESFEVLECCISTSGTMVRLSLVYRPPTSSSIAHFYEEFSDYLARITTSPGQPLIMGDFNFHVDDKDDHRATQFLDILDSFGIRQYVSNPTHRNGHTLDLVMSRSSENLVLSAAAVDHGFPDHYPVFVCLSLMKPALPTRQVLYRKMKEIAPDALRNAIHNSNLPLSPSSAGNFALDDLIDLYDNELVRILDDLAPLKLKTITVRPESKWYNDDLRRAKQKRRQAERRWRKTGLVVHRQIFIAERQNVNDLLLKTRQNYYNDRINESRGNTKELFKFANTLLGRDRGSPLPPDKSNTELASLFSDFFINKINNIRDNIPNTDIPITNHLPSTNLDTLLTEFDPVTQKSVAGIIKSLSNKSCDLDPMPTALIKTAFNALSPTITEIINKSIDMGVFPSHFKQALVRPILKKSSLDPSNYNNYRPISNLSLISKVLERVVAAQLTKHFQQNNLHETFQSAYRQHHSTETALLRVQNDITLALGDQKIVLLVMLDLSAAFDTVNHDQLQEKLEELGIAGKALQWFSSYLHYRRQTVSINGSRSDTKELSCGVPQGSVLGPILFNVYMTSLGHLLRQHIPNYHFYADDTQIYLSAKLNELDNAVHQIEQCVSIVEGWMSQHQLKMNNDKTEFLIISSKQLASKFTKPSLKLSGLAVEPVKLARNIGVTMDHHGTLDTHITNVSRNAYYQLNNINRLKKFMSQESLECLIHAFVTTKLDYCNSLFCGACKSSIKKLQRVQNTAARILTGHRKSEHITPVLRQLHWLPVEQRIKFKLLVITFKALNDLAPDYLQELLTLHRPPRSLRSAEKNLLVVPRTKSSLVTSRSFSVAAPILWNNLPTDIRCNSNFTTFKSQVKTYLFKEYFNF